jgi:hypothetical protein
METPNLNQDASQSRKFDSKASNATSSTDAVRRPSANLSCQGQTVEITAPGSLFLSDAELIKYCHDIGRPLPFALSSLQKDRKDGRLGGIPYRRIGKALIVYSPDEVFAFLFDSPIIQATPRPAPKAQPGRPTKSQSVAKARAAAAAAQKAGVQS